MSPTQKSNETSEVVSNLRSYFGHLSEHIGNPVQKVLGAHITLSEDYDDPSFNFVFPDFTITDYEVFQEVYNHIKNNIKANTTWVLGSKMKEVSGWLSDNGLNSISKPKKMLLSVSNYVFPSYAPNASNCRLDIIETEEELLIYDAICAECFFHPPKIAFNLFKGFFRQKDLNFRIMLLRINGTVCGGCIVYIDGNNAGFYADGILKPYRNAGFGTFMIMKRIEIAKAMNCKYAVAQCFPMSVSIYERCGFKNIGNLVLQSNH